MKEKQGNLFPDAAQVMGTLSTYADRLTHEIEAVEKTIERKDTELGELNEELARVRASQQAVAKARIVDEKEAAGPAAADKKK